MGGAGSVSRARSEKRLFADLRGRYSRCGNVLDARAVARAGFVRACRRRQAGQGLAPARPVAEIREARNARAQRGQRLPANWRRTGKKPVATKRPDGRFQMANHGRGRQSELRPAAPEAAAESTMDAGAVDSGTSLLVSGRWRPTGCGRHATYKRRCFYAPFNAASLASTSRLPIPRRAAIAANDPALGFVLPASQA